jgi:hypothetical protein
MRGDSVEAIAARLGARAAGRTEADIQSDVRKFLLDAPLELTERGVIDVKLEAQAGAGRRIDVEAGCAAIEVKRSLDSRNVFDKAVAQLGGYVAQRTEERGQRYVGVLTDGRTWGLFHLTPDGRLSEVSRLHVASGADAPSLVAWLDHVLATTFDVKPTQAEIVRRLGAGSPGFALDLADLTSLYESCRNDPDVRLKRELWGRLLVAALGTNFDDSDELFVAHTYLVLTTELLAHAVVGIPVDDPATDVRDLLEGTRFDLVGLHGVVEADFFDWPAATPTGVPIIRGIARRLARFDWAAVDHDVLKALYESVIDPDTRHRLGEYYTPDWLADRMIRQTFTDPLNQRLLDPACGSGTFLFWAIRHLIAACQAEEMPNREIVRRVTLQVNGIDLHPVAVTLARVTYLLALGPERLQDRDELTIPVWLGDSVRWEQDETMLAGGGITIRTSDKLEFFEQELRFPERASARNPGTNPPPIGGLLNRHGVTNPTDRAAVELVFARLCDLHDHGRNHIWGYYIRNLARPLSFTRADGRVDGLVGNPPWLAYRHMPERLQAAYRQLASERGLWAGGKNATHQDLSDLFVSRAVEQYLKPGGRFAFVMPFAVLSRSPVPGLSLGGLVLTNRRRRSGGVRPAGGVGGGEAATVPSAAVCGGWEADWAATEAAARRHLVGRACVDPPRFMARGRERTFRGGGPHTDGRRRSWGLAVPVAVQAGRNVGPQGPDRGRGDGPRPVGHCCRSNGDPIGPQHAGETAVEEPPIQKRRRGAPVRAFDGVRGDDRRVPTARSGVGRDPIRRRRVDVRRERGT